MIQFPYLKSVAIFDNKIGLTPCSRSLVPILLLALLVEITAPSTQISRIGSCPRVHIYSNRVSSCPSFPSHSKANVAHAAPKPVTWTVPDGPNLDSQAAKQFTSGLNYQKSSTVPSPTRNLPPLEDATGDSLDQQLPTFNEFHAMHSEDSVRDARVDVPDAKYEATNGKSQHFGSTQDKQTPTTVTSDGSAHANSSAQNALGSDHSMNSSHISGKDHSNGIRQSFPESTVPEPSSHQTAAGEASSTAHREESDATSLPHKGDTSESQPPQTESSTITLRRNVAAVGCFAKLLEASKALKNPDAVLNGNNDEYMNVPCSSEKWFVIETCEPVQLREIEIANYELFSSRIKTFRVLISDRYPVKTWEVAGTFTARDVKGLQSFHLRSDKLIKFVKFELLDHHGSEHYCPLTMVRLFGRVADDLDDEEDSLTLQTPSVPLVDTPVTVEPQVDNSRPNESTFTSPSGSQEDVSQPLGSANTSESSMEAEGTNLASELPTQANDAQGSPVNPSEPGSSSSFDGLQSDGLMMSSAGPDQSAGSFDANEKCTSKSAQTCPSKGENVESTREHATQPNAKGDAHTSTQPSPTMPANSAVHTNDVYPMMGNQLSDPSLFGRVKGFLSNMFQFSLSVFTNSSRSLNDPTASRGQYNLSEIPICPQHLAAVNTLLYYNLLSPSDTDGTTAIDLPQPKRYSLFLLASCFEQLNRYVQTADSLIGNSPIVIKDRILSLPPNHESSVIPHCFESAQLLNLTFFNGPHPCRSTSDPLWNSDFSILELFVAYLYRSQMKISPLQSHCAFDWWGGNGHSMVESKEIAEFHTMCPRLPDFVVNPTGFKPRNQHASSPHPPTVSTEDLSGSEPRGNAASASIRDQVQQQQREQRVVPGALAGSRKDTALMRLNNRVRLLERNVSVSMRYLEELSQSYRRQMERLSRSFNLTVAWLKATAQGAEERDQMQQMRINELEKRLDELLARVRSGFNASDGVTDLPLVNLSSSVPDALPSTRPPTPPLPNFDWGSSSSYDVWPQFAEEFSEVDGIVETEDDCLTTLSQRIDGFAENGRGHNPELSYEHHSHMEGWVPWIWSLFSTKSFMMWKLRIVEWSEAYSNVIGTLFLALLHFVFAFLSHLIIYVTWLRPKCAKLLADRCVAFPAHVKPIDYRVGEKHKLPNGTVMRSFDCEVEPRNPPTSPSYETLSTTSQFSDIRLEQVNSTKNTCASLTQVHVSCSPQRPVVDGASSHHSLNGLERRSVGTTTSMTNGSHAADNSVSSSLHFNGCRPSENLFTGMHSTSDRLKEHHIGLSKSARRRRNRQIRAKSSSTNWHRS